MLAGVGIGASLLWIASAALPTRLEQGIFHSVEVTGSGSATVERSWLGRRRLQLSEINLPAIQSAQVRLIAADDAFDTSTAAGTVSVVVGTLGPHQREATFWLDPKIDMKAFRAVTLWSDGLEGNLMTAPLKTVSFFPIFK